MTGEQSRVQMLTSWALLFLVLVLIAITLGVYDRQDASTASIQSLIDEDKVYEAEWQHCPEGSQPITMKVSDESWAAFQMRLNNMITAYPANCP